MEKISLFPTNIYRTRIDPYLWDKEKFVRQSIESYNIDPNRHARNMPDSEFHTTYRDWENDKFNRIDCNVVKDVYTKVILEFINSLRLKRSVEYKWNLINISIGKDNWYDWHYHGDPYDKDNYKNEYVMVHYINFDNTVHRPTSFKNPLLHSIYENNMTMRSLLENCEENSSYFGTWELDTNEDDVIFFPSYIFHGVRKKGSNTEKFRIITSTHIDLKYNDEEKIG